MVPGAIPDTVPDNDPIVAMPVEPEIQSPPGTPSVRVVAAPVHTVVTPVTETGVVLTVTIVVILQPVGNV